MLPVADWRGGEGGHHGDWLAGDRELCQDSETMTSHFRGYGLLLNLCPLEENERVQAYLIQRMDR